MRPKPSPLSLPFRLRLTSALTPADLISVRVHHDTAPLGTRFRPFGSIRGELETQPRQPVLLPKPPGKLLIEVAEYELPVPPGRQVGQTRSCTKRLPPGLDPKAD